MNAKTKTLVIRFSSVGDIVLSTPLLRVLRKRFPEGQIDFVTRKEYSELVRSNHNINVTYEYDAATGFEGLRKLKKRILAEKYDLIVDIHDSLRSKYLRSLHGNSESVVLNKRKFERYMLVRRKKNLYKEIVSVVDRYIEPLKKYGVENDGKGLELHIPDETLFGVSGKIAKIHLSQFEKVVGLCPSSRHFTKRWPASRFADLGAKFCKEHGAKILIFGGSEDRDLCSAVEAQIRLTRGADSATSLAGEFSLMESAAAMQFCDAIVTNDSGLMHLAAAMQKNVVAVFGSTVREFGFYPVGSRNVVVERQGLPCRPCSHIGRPSCPEGHFKCMLDIAVDEVYEKSRMMLAPN